MLFAGASIGSVPLIAVNNLVAASVALLTALIVTRMRYGKPDASITANGFVIGTGCYLRRLLTGFPGGGRSDRTGRGPRGSLLGGVA